MYDDRREYKREDYVQSSNSLFHFMTSSEYLKDALKRKALCPRYCSEDISYLNITSGEDFFDKVAVLQKCFCDIPLRNIFKRFPLNLAENNKLLDEQKENLPTSFSHTDLYGKYALAFSKSWGEKRKLQPVHYLSEEADFVERFSKMFQDAIKEDNLPDSISDTLLNWICYFKPLRGTMWRHWETDGYEKFELEVHKNFHDEHEWRYVPLGIEIEGKPIDCVIANEAVISHFTQEINERIESELCKSLWLPFQYEDILYIIVPDNAGRIEIINSIHALSNDMFSKGKEDIQKSILISKILVLDDVKKDF